MCAEGTSCRGGTWTPIKRNMKLFLLILTFTLFTVFAGFPRSVRKTSEVRTVTNPSEVRTVKKAVADSKGPKTLKDRTEIMVWLEALFRDDRHRTIEDMNFIFREFSKTNPRIKARYIQLRDIYGKLLNGKKLKKKNMVGKKSAKYKRTMREAGRIVMLAMNEFEIKAGFDLSEYQGLKRLTYFYFKDLEAKIEELFE